MAAAHEALSPQMKARIQGLIVEHGVGDSRLNLPGEYRGGNTKGLPVQTRATVRHPLVIRHPQTGVKVLYAPSGSPFGIVDMEADDAMELLRELKIHATEPRFTQRAAARTGNLVIWDNYAVMHSATPTRYSDGDGERRLLYRISTRDVLQL
jgi:taurine dioxygenase